MGRATSEKLLINCPAALLCLAIAAGSALAEDELSTPNLFDNPSFEGTDADGRPTGWIMRIADGLSWAVDREIKHDGRQSLRITGENVKEKFVGLRHAAPLRLKRNRMYEVSGWAKGKDLSFTTGGGGGNALWFHIYAGKTQRLGDFSLGVEKGTYDWKQFSRRYTTTASVTLVPVGPSGVNGTLWLDELVIREVEVIPERPSVGARELVAHYKEVLQSSGGKLTLLFAPPTKKILRKMMSDEGVISSGTHTRVSLARNEHEGVQIIAAALWGDLGGVDVSTSSVLSKETGAAATGLNVSWNPVGYVGFSDGERLVSDPWPDVLLPAGEFNVREGELQPIWVDVHADETAVAGDYEVIVSVKAANSPDPVPARIDIHVYDFAIPKRNSLPTAFGARLSSTRNLLYEHRLMPRRIAAHLEGFHDYEAGVSKPFREFADVRPLVEKGLEDHLAKGGTMFAMDIPYFRGCFAGGTHSAGAHGDFNLVYNKERADYIVRYHREFAQFLREKDLLGNAYEYLWDEPTPARFENVRTIRELIRQADPEIRCMMAGTLHEELAGVIDIWVPITDNWDENQELAAKLRERGDEMWWYITGGPELPYASFSRIDPEFDLLGARLLLWMVWKHRIQGFLYWTTDWWIGSTEQSPWHGPLNRIGKTTDCWWYKGTGPYPPGDGYLTYPMPGSDNRGAALSTIRLEAIRDGLEDREYFVLLEETIEAAKDNSTLSEEVAEARELLPVPTDIVESLTKYTDSDALLRAHRDTVARSIEALGQSEGAGK